MQPSQYTNIAFISYKREDEELAKWLQKKLEYYKLPTEIRKKNPDLEFSAHPRHVFKDTTDLSGGVLAKAIKDGLDSSKFLVVICSPRAAKSEWVCKEVQDFIDSGREEYIIPFIIDGEPYAKNPDNECFPTALKTLAGERELLGININENGRDSAAVKVVARLFELKFDSLWDRFQREEEKRRRTIYLMTTLSVAIFVSVGFIIYNLYTNRQHEEIKKREEISKRLVTEGRLSLKDGNFYDAIRFGLQSYECHSDIADVDSFIFTLNERINNWGDEYKHTAQIKIHGNPSLVLAHPRKDAFIIVSHVDYSHNNAYFVNAKTGLVEDSIRIQNNDYWECGTFSTDGKLVYLWSGSNVFVWDVNTHRAGINSCNLGKVLFCSERTCFVFNKDKELCILNEKGAVIYKCRIDDNIQPNDLPVAINPIRHQIAFMHKSDNLDDNAFLAVYNYQTGKKVFEKSYKGISNYPQLMGFAPNGKLCVICVRCTDIIDIQENREPYIYTYDYGGWDACYSINNDKFITTDLDTIFVNRYDKQFISVPKSSQYSNIRKIGLSSNEETILSADENGVVHIYHKKPFVYNSYVDFGCYNLLFDYNQVNGRFVFKLESWGDGTSLVAFENNFSRFWSKYFNDIYSNSVLSNDGNIVYYKDGKIHWWDYQSQFETGSATSEYTTKILQSTDDKIVISYHYDSLFVYNNNEKRLLYSLKPFTTNYSIHDVTFNSRGDMAVVCKEKLNLYKSTNLKQPYKKITLKNTGYSDVSIALLNNELFYYGDYKIWKLDLSTNQESQISSIAGDVSRGHFSKPYKSMLLFYTSDGTIYLFKDGEVLTYENPFMIADAEIINDNEIMIVGGRRREATIIPIEVFVSDEEKSNIEYVTRKLRQIIK